MKQKIISSILIVALMHYFQACVVYKDAKEDDLGGLVDSGSKITNAVLMTGELVKFNKSGGEMINKQEGITGTSDKGKKIFHPVSQIKQMYPVGSEDQISYKDLLKDTTVRISRLLLNNNQEVFFDSAGGAYIPSGYFLRGITDNNKYIEIPIGKILYVENKKIDGVMTFVATIGVLLGAGLVVILLALATKKSCPFIYSFDGEKYVFDAEPLGGAVAKAYERTEYSKLANLKEVDGVFKLRITNEVYETEYIDEMSLFVVDHPQGTEVTMNNDDSIFALKGMQRPIYAMDESGNDLMPFVKAKDEVMWMTKMPVNDGNKLRNKISLGFNKPDGAKKAWLVYNTGTTHWGSVMISEMLELYGTGLHDHYAKLNEKGDYYNTTMNFLQREELYEMKLMMNKGGKWESQGLLQGGGPFKTGERVLELDLTGVEGDRVEVQMNPPVGFWTLGYFSITYEPPLPATGREVKVASATDNNGNDVSGPVSLSDEEYHLMPRTGDWFNAEYKAPAKQEGFGRTVFMKTKGWYDIHMPVLTNGPDLVTLFGLVSRPGAVVKFSNERYTKWAEQVSK